MLMVDLILAVCMIEDAKACREEHLYFQAGGTLNQCLAQALPTMAQWAGAHPQWRIAGYHCEWVTGEEEKT